MTPDEIARCRAETAGCAHVLHFNNAGASLVPDIVHKAVTGHLERERLTGPYEAHAAAAKEIDSFYTEIAGMLGAGPDEIAYVENATRAWDMAFYSLPLREGDTILTARAEYSSNYLAFLQMAKRKGVTVGIAPDDSSGQVDVDALERMIDKTTKLIAITHVPTQGGLVNPAAEVGRVARRHGILYLLDACQSAGQMPLDVNEIGCDMLSATGRKFLRGPRGTGFLYVKKALADTLEPVFVDLHSADWIDENQYRFVEGAKRFENWECYYAGKLGLAEAVHYARAIGLDRIEKRNTALAAQLRSELSKLSSVKVADQGSRKCAIVTFSKDGLSADAIKQKLLAQAINVSVSQGIYARLDLPHRGFPALVRASVHYYNTEEEVERFVKAVAELR